MIVELNLLCHKGQTWPQVDVHGQVLHNHTEVLDAYVRRQHCTVLIQEPSICVEYVEKPQSETVIDSNGNIMHDQHVAVDRIAIDGITLDLALIARVAEFRARYRDDYVEHCRQNLIEIDSGPLRTLDFYHAGVWQLTWQESFWPWYQQQRDQIKLQYHDLKKYANALGDDRANIKQQLDDFRQKFFA